MPNLYFQFDEKWIEARPQDYMFDYYGDGVDCLLFIDAIDEPSNILGVPVLIDYYAMHDVGKGTIRWAPHTNSAKSDVYVSDVPINPKELKAKPREEEFYGSSALFWIVTILYIAIIAWAYYSFVYKIHKDSE